MRTRYSPSEFAFQTMDQLWSDWSPVGLKLQKTFSLRGR